MEGSPAQVPLLEALPLAQYLAVGNVFSEFHARKGGCLGQDTFADSPIINIVPIKWFVIASHYCWLI